MPNIRIIIQVLDDEVHLLELIGKMFEGSADYTVSLFSNPNEFYEAFNKDTDLVITDVRVKQGYDVLHAITTIKAKSPNCFIIVMSAYFDIPILQNLIRLGIDDTVTKTHDINWLQDLLNAVNRLHPKLLHRSEIKGLLNK